jgi:hypothetical protein
MRPQDLHKISTDPLDSLLAACLGDSAACQIFRDGVVAMARPAMDFSHEIAGQKALLALEIPLPLIGERVLHKVSVAPRAPAIRFEGHGI